MATERGIAWYAQELLKTLVSDREDILLLLDKYSRGEHRVPYTPDNADREFRDLAKKAVTNLVEMPVNAVAQGTAVDGFRPGDDQDNGKLSYKDLPQWKFFQRNSLDAKQDAIHRGALRFGHSFVLVEKDKKREGFAKARGLSALTTTALFDDPANDIEPVAALTVTRWPSDDEDGVGQATVWDDSRSYTVLFDAGLKITSTKKHDLHGFNECPVTRFAPQVDLDGRTTGIIEPLIPLQDRINQTNFNLLIAQSYSAFKVRTVTGMAPPMMTEPVTDETGKVIGSKPVIDPATGQPKPRPLNLLSKSVLIAEDKDTKFGTLDETDLSGHISASKLAIQQFTAVSQTPPHYALGEIANLSADALDAAQQTLDRLTDNVKSSFGESWERVVRLAMHLEGAAGADDMEAEVIWADKDARAWAAFADGAGKLVSELGIPKRGLWPRVPGVTQNELATWQDLRDEEDRELQMTDSLLRATNNEPAPAGSRVPTRRTTVRTDDLTA